MRVLTVEKFLSGEIEQRMRGCDVEETISFAFGHVLGATRQQALALSSEDRA